MCRLVGSLIFKLLHLELNSGKKTPAPTEPIYASSRKPRLPGPQAKRSPSLLDRYLAASFSPWTFVTFFDPLPVISVLNSSMGTLANSGFAFLLSWIITKIKRALVGGMSVAS